MLPRLPLLRLSMRAAGDTDARLLSTGLLQRLGLGRPASNAALSATACTAVMIGLQLLAQGAAAHTGMGSTTAARHRLLPPLLLLCVDAALARCQRSLLLLALLLPPPLRTA
jgi:hypothetical protein